jgi:hypothetical protein
MEVHMVLSLSKPSIWNDGTSNSSENEQSTEILRSAFPLLRSFKCFPFVGRPMEKEEVYHFIVQRFLNQLKSTSNDLSLLSGNKRRRVD